MALGLGASLGLGIALVLSVRNRPLAQSRVGRQTLKFSGVLNTKRGIVAVGGALVAAGVAWFVSGIPGLGLVVGMTVGALPLVISRVRAARAAKARASEWPVVIDDLTARFRSGGTVTDALAFLAESTRGQIRDGARDFMVAVTTTADVSQSLDLAKSRWRDGVGDRVAETLRLASDCGGAGVMTALAALGRDVRRELAVAAEVSTRSAWIRVAATVGAVAPWIAVLVLSLRPEGRSAYATAEGSVLLVVGYVMTIVAYLVMVRIARPVAEPRVFS